MTYQDLIRLIKYTKPEDIHEREALVREYCYSKNIGLNKIYEEVK